MSSRRVQSDCDFVMEAVVDWVKVTPNIFKSFGYQRLSCTTTEGPRSTHRERAILFCFTDCFKLLILNLFHDRVHSVEITIAFKTSCMRFIYRREELVSFLLSVSRGLVLICFLIRAIFTVIERSSSWVENVWLSSQIVRRVMLVLVMPSILAAASRNHFVSQQLLQVAFGKLQLALVLPDFIVVVILIGLLCCLLQILHLLGILLPRVQWLLSWS